MWRVYIFVCIAGMRREGERERERANAILRNTRKRALKLTILKRNTHIITPVR